MVTCIVLIIVMLEIVAGIIIDFNTAGDGGKDFVHVLAEDGTIKIFHAFDVEVISASR